MARSPTHDNHPGRTRRKRDIAVSGTLAAALRRSARIEGLIRENPGSFRILTGDRPAGYLHLGHYFSRLANRVRELDLLIAYMMPVERDWPCARHAYAGRERGCATGS
jgi:hypothetical protein